MTAGAYTSPRLAEAFALAEDLHRGQVRKKTLAPTLSHLMAVAALVLEHGGDEEEVMAALLHDAVEDCGGRPVLERIGQQFGERVAAIVEGCTDSLETPKAPWIERKRCFLDHLHDASPSTLLVSLADKVHNVASLTEEYRRAGEALWERFSASREETLWYYRELLDIFAAQVPDRCIRLVGRLERSLAELTALICKSTT